MKPPYPLWWLDRRAYPYASRYWDTGAGRMHYIDEGEGEAVVLVHGVPTWSFNYRHLIRSLLPHYRCIAMDHLGFGLLDKPSGWSYAPEALAAHLEELIRGLELKDITLVVHDWGGPLGLSYALRWPENVRRLVLFNTWMWPNEGVRARLTTRLLASPLYHALEDRWGITARLFIPLAMANRQALTPEVHRHYLEPLRNRAERQGCWALVRAIHHSEGWVAELWRQRSRIRQLPALILWGLKDPAFTRSDLKRWEELLVSAETRAYEVGHYPHEEIPDKVCARLGEFLRDT